MNAATMLGDMNSDTPPPEAPGIFDVYLSRYMDAWNRGDLAEIVAAYHTPCFVFKRDHCHVHVDDAAKEAYFGALLDATRSELATGARWHRLDLRVQALGVTCALATVRWVLTRPDGTAVEDYFDSYLFGRVSGRWCFLGDTVHEAGAL